MANSKWCAEGKHEWCFNRDASETHCTCECHKPNAERDPDLARTIETRELIATVRRVAKEQPLYRPETILHLNLAAAELERMAYPPQSDASAEQRR